MGENISLLSQLPDMITALVCIGFGYYYTRYYQGKANISEEKNRRRERILEKHGTAFKFGLGVLYTVGIIHLIVSVYDFMA